MISALLSFPLLVTSSESCICDVLNFSSNIVISISQLLRSILLASQLPLVYPANRLQLYLIVKKGANGITQRPR